MISLRPTFFLAALAGAVLSGLPMPADLRAQTPGPGGTFKVLNGAAPWYDRVGVWELSDVPASLVDEATELPQGACGTRALVKPEGAASLLIGVCQKDLETFKKEFPDALATEDALAVRNPKGGDPLPYTAVYVPAAPAQVAPRGLVAGLILLRIDPPAPSGAAAGPAPSPQASPTGAAAEAKPAASVPAAFEVPGSRDKFDVYLLMGQSNMLGRDTSKLAEQTDNTRIGSMDGNSGWVVARDPMWGGSGTGPGISFAREMLKKSPEDHKIGLVQCAVGGTPLSRWVKGGDLYQRALTRARAAAKRGTLKGILWHQGESDSGKQEDASTYETRLAKMIADFRADLGTPNLPVVVGKLGPFLDAKPSPFAGLVNTGIAKIAGSVPHAGLADSAGLKDRGDHLHFNAESQIEFGKRYAQAMAKL